MMVEESKLLISCETIGEIEAEIIDKNPETADAIIKALPFEGPAHVWGDEIYFNIPVGASEENSQQEMEMGDIAFWPMGNAMCIFFGPTPVSDDEKPKAYSPVNLFARIVGDAKVLKKVREGEVIRVKKI
ncbi:MAG: hypothetical protein JSV56_05135 [Methanomassiliicoccales archaeon]|nr:MAG: hypothetical protein JSV56_05135 [Methanomassiliicoccales archaeon]